MTIWAMLRDAMRCLAVPAVEPTFFVGSKLPHAQNQKGPPLEGRPFLIGCGGRIYRLALLDVVSVMLHLQHVSARTGMYIHRPHLQLKRAPRAKALGTFLMVAGAGFTVCGLYREQ